MSETLALPPRPGQSTALAGTDRAYTLRVVANNRDGVLDRLIGMLRRRRANLLALIYVPGERPHTVSITFRIDDSEVSFEHLTQQLHKIVDIREILCLSPERVNAYELALAMVKGETSGVSSSYSVV